MELAPLDSLRVVVVVDSSIPGWSGGVSGRGTEVGCGMLELSDDVARGQGQLVVNEIKSLTRLIVKFASINLCILKSVIHTIK